MLALCAGSCSARYRSWLPDRFDVKGRLKKTLPVAVCPNHFDRRIATQRSGFTIHGLELFPQKKNHIAKIVIPSYATGAMQKQLDEYGIDEVTIYPDLTGLGAAVSRNFLVRESIEPPDGLTQDSGRPPFTEWACSPLGKSRKVYSFSPQIAMR